MIIKLAYLYPNLAQLEYFQQSLNFFMYSFGLMTIENVHNIKEAFN